MEETRPEVDTPVVDQLRDDIKLAKRKRDDYLPTWQRNVAERRGKTFDTAADEGRSAVPLDWTITRTKAAQLFSQMPQVRHTAKNKQFEDGVPVYSQIVNDLLTTANVEAVMSECVVDVVNAAGVGAAIVRYEALTAPTEVPAIEMDMLPPEAQMAAMTGQLQIPMVKATKVTDRRFTVDRVSPSDLLWPTTFRLSDWDKASWLGHSARVSWVKAKRMFNLSDDDKDSVVTAAKKRQDVSTPSTDSTTVEEAQVDYDEVFYWRHLYHEDETYFDAIQRVVFVAGKEEPVINEPWAGQQFDQETGTYIGACLLPIRVLTLNYISDEAVPPSDSAMIRPMVEQLQQSRKDMADQRKHSKPMRWFNVDGVDPTVIEALVKGTWQGAIPVIGDGSRSIGEVARSAMPRENMDFDRTLKQDVQEAVGVGPNQMNTFASGERSANEAEIVHQSFQTDIGKQRASTAMFLVGIAEVIGGLWCLYGAVEENGIGASIGPDGIQRLEAIGRDRINQKFVSEIRADSMVRVDAQAIVQQTSQVLNLTAQSGFINPKPLLRRIFEASGIDPAEVLVDPQPKGPEPPKIGYSFKGEDLNDPVVLAIIAASGQGPKPEDIEAAKQMRMSALMPPSGGNGQPPIPGGPTSPPQPGAPPVPPGHAAPPPGAGHPPIPLDPKTPDKANPDWESSPRVITRRSEN